MGRVSAAFIILLLLLVKTASCGFLPQPETPGEPPASLFVHFIDVGQGDAIFIDAPAQNVIIDGGDRAAGPGVVAYLEEQGVEKVDLVVATHPHADHIGGLIDVLGVFHVAEVLDPGVVHTTCTFADYLEALASSKAIFAEGRAGMKRDLGSGVMLKVLHPVAPSDDDLNNASVVTRLTFEEVSFLFTGDAEGAAETALLQRGVELQSNLLKVGHHGSRTSTTEPFLQAVDPEFAVIMCGAKNRYGHPHQETLALLHAYGVEIYRTDLHGDIVFFTDGYTLELNAAGPSGYVPAAETAAARTSFLLKFGCFRQEYSAICRIVSADTDLNEFPGLHGEVYLPGHVKGGTAEQKKAYGAAPARSGRAVKEAKILICRIRSCFGMQFQDGPACDRVTAGTWLYREAG